MKKYQWIMSAIAFMLTISVLVPHTARAEEGRIKLELEQDTLSQYFDLYTQTENAQSFFARDGLLYSTGKAENKALLKTPNNLSSFVLEADFYPLDEICPMDCGFYIYANEPADGLDAISAYNVNLERDVYGGSIAVKIHRFEQSYLGETAIVRLKMKSTRVSLKVHANKGRVKVYLFGDSTPVLDVTLASWRPGQVGLRTFSGSGAKIGNFRLTASDFPVDTSELQGLIARAENEYADLYTQTSFAELPLALAHAREAMDSDTQTIVDEAAEKLKTALSGLRKAYTFTQLSNSVVRAKILIDEGEQKYTANSFASLKLVLARAENINADSGEDTISYMTQLLEQTMSYLTPYFV